MHRNVDRDVHKHSKDEKKHYVSCTRNTKEEDEEAYNEREKKKHYRKLYVRKKHTNPDEDSTVTNKLKELKDLEKTKKREKYEQDKRDRLRRHYHHHSIPEPHPVHEKIVMPIYETTNKYPKCQNKHERRKHKQTHRRENNEENEGNFLCTQPEGNERKIRVSRPKEREQRANEVLNPHNNHPPPQVVNIHNKKAHHKNKIERVKSKTQILKESKSTVNIGAYQKFYVREENYETHKKKKLKEKAAEINTNKIHKRIRKPILVVNEEPPNITVAEINFKQKEEELKQYYENLVHTLMAKKIEDAVIGDQQMANMFKILNDNYMAKTLNSCRQEIGDQQMDTVVVEEPVRGRPSKIDKREKKPINAVPNIIIKNIESQSFPTEASPKGRKSRLRKRHKSLEKILEENQAIQKVEQATKGIQTEDVEPLPKRKKICLRCKHMSAVDIQPNYGDMSEGDAVSVEVRKQLPFFKNYYKYADLDRLGQRSKLGNLVSDCNKYFTGSTDYSDIGSDIPTSDHKTAKLPPKTKNTSTAMSKEKLTYDYKNKDPHLPNKPPNKPTPKASRFNKITEEPNLTVKDKHSGKRDSETHPVNLRKSNSELSMKFLKNPVIYGNESSQEETSDNDRRLHSIQCEQNVPPKARYYYKEYYGTIKEDGNKRRRTDDYVDKETNVHYKPVKSELSRNRKKSEPKETKWIEVPKELKWIEKPKETKQIEEPKEPKRIEEPKERKWVEEPKKTKWIEEPKETKRIKEPKERKWVEEPKERKRIEEPKERKWIEEPKKTKRIEGPKESTPIMPHSRKESAKLVLKDDSPSPDRSVSGNSSGSEVSTRMSLFQLIEALECEQNISAAKRSKQYYEDFLEFYNQQERKRNAERERTEVEISEVQIPYYKTVKMAELERNRNKKESVPEEVKLEVKPEVKPEVKLELKPKAKPEVKPKLKPEIKPKIKPVVKPKLVEDQKQITPRSMPHPRNKSAKNAKISNDSSPDRNLPSPIRRTFIKSKLDLPAFENLSIKPMEVVEENKKPDKPKVRKTPRLRPNAKKSKSELDLRVKKLPLRATRVNSYLSLNNCNQPGTANQLSVRSSDHDKNSVFNHMSNFLFTKDFKGSKMSAYQKRKHYDDNIRKRLKNKQDEDKSKKTLSPQNFEVRFLTVDNVNKNQEFANRAEESEKKKRGNISMQTENVVEVPVKPKPVKTKKQKPSSSNEVKKKPSRVLYPTVPIPDHRVFRPKTVAVHYKQTSEAIRDEATVCKLMNLPSAFVRSRTPSNKRRVTKLKAETSSLSSQTMKAFHSTEPGTPPIELLPKRSRSFCDFRVDDRPVRDSDSKSHADSKVLDYLNRQSNHESSEEEELATSERSSSTNKSIELARTKTVVRINVRNEAEASNLKQSSATLKKSSSHVKKQKPVNKPESVQTLYSPTPSRNKSSTSTSTFRRPPSRPLLKCNPSAYKFLYESESSLNLVDLQTNETVIKMKQPHTFIGRVAVYEKVSSDESGYNSINSRKCHSLTNFFKRPNIAALFKNSSDTDHKKSEGSTYFSNSNIKRDSESIQGSKNNLLFDQMSKDCQAYARKMCEQLDCKNKETQEYEEIPLGVLLQKHGSYLQKSATNSFVSSNTVISSEHQSQSETDTLVAKSSANLRLNSSFGKMQDKREDSRTIVESMLYNEPLKKTTNINNSDHILNFLTTTKCVRSLTDTRTKEIKSSPMTACEYKSLVFDLSNISFQNSQTKSTKKVEEFYKIKDTRSNLTDSTSQTDSKVSIRESTSSSSASVNQRFFDNLLEIYEKELNLSLVLNNDDDFLYGCLMGVVNEYMNQNMKKKRNFKSLFKRKNKSCNSEATTLDTASQFTIDDQFESLDSESKESLINSQELQRMASNATKHFSLLAQAVMSNRGISDELKICGFLRILKRIENGDFTVLRREDTNFEDEVKSELKKTFLNCYLTAYQAAKKIKRKFVDNDVKLIRTLVCKYRLGSLSNNNLLASYIGLAKIQTEDQLKAAITYTLRLDDDEINVEEFEKFCSTNCKT